MAAIKLAKDGHQLLLHGRNAEKLSSVVSEVKSRSGNENVQGFVADFSDLDAVKVMAERIQNDYSRIDVLVNNAGIFKSKNPRLDNGMDIRMVVNYLAPYVLTDVLLPLIRNSEEPRIINLSSAAQASISTDLLLGKVTGSDRESYAQSKLAILMWSFYLAKKEPDISVIALNPGSLLNTNMVREAYGNFWSSADKGADIIYELSVSEQHQGETGKYFDNDQGQYGQAHQNAYKEDLIQQLINTTNEILS